MVIEQSLMESVFGEMVPWEDFPSNDWPQAEGVGSGASLATTIDDRSDGKYRPIYQNEIDLARQTAMVRRVIGMNELTEAVTTALKVYVFGSGMEVSVRAKRGCEVPPGLVDDIRRIVDRFLETNGFINGLDVEIHQRTRDDGEACVPIERDGNNIICEPVETVQLTEPRAGRDLEAWIEQTYGIDFDTFVPSWSFGVLSDKRRPSRPKGYHVVYDGGGCDWQFFPTEEFVHIRRNVPRSAKRGVSDWLAVIDRLTRGMKLVRNLGHGAALQSAIAWIEEYVQGTPQAQMLASGSPSVGGNVPNGRSGGSRTDRSVTYREGSILRVGAGKQYKPGPLGAERNAGFQIVEEMLERLVGTRWLITYSMISGDASNNNFASSLVAESPFVKAREADQTFYGGAYVSLLWKVVRMAWKCGWLDTRGIPFEKLATMIDIVCGFVSPATRDRGALVDQLVKEVGLGTTSLRTAATQLDRDYDEEVAAGAKPASPFGSGGPAPGVPEAGGSPITPPEGVGEMSDLTARQFDRNIRAIGKALEAFMAGGSRVVAKGTLTALGVPDAKAEEYLNDAADGSVDSPELTANDATVAAGVQGALESVQSTEEAKAILQSLRNYP